MTVSFTKLFIKQAKKLSSELKKQLEQRLALFCKDPLHPALNNHKLKGKFKDYRSINISGDVRALYFQREDEAIFDIVGTHSQLYK